MLFSYHNRLLQHIRKKLPASLNALVDADDILQQTYVAAFRGFGQFEPRSEQAFYRWLATIAENQVLDAIKGQKRKKRGGDFKRVESRPHENASSMANLLDMLSGDGRSPSTLAAGAEGVRALQVAMAGLPDDYREVIRLTCIDGRSLQEAAEEMDRPKDAVRGLLYRAKKKMRDVMGQTSLWFTKH